MEELFNIRITSDSNLENKFNNLSEFTSRLPNTVNLNLNDNYFVGAEAIFLPPCYECQSSDTVSFLNYSYDKMSALLDDYKFNEEIKFREDLNIFNHKNNEKIQLDRKHEEQKSFHIERAAKVERENLNSKVMDDKSLTSVNLFNFLFITLSQLTHFEFLNAEYFKEFLNPTLNFRAFNLSNTPLYSSIELIADLNHLQEPLNENQNIFGVFKRAKNEDRVYYKKFATIPLNLRSLIHKDEDVHNFLFPISEEDVSRLENFHARLVQHHPYKIKEILFTCIQQIINNFSIESKEVKSDAKMFLSFLQVNHKNLCKSFNEFLRLEYNMNLLLKRFIEKFIDITFRIKDFLINERKDIQIFPTPIFSKPNLVIIYCDLVSDSFFNDKRAKIIKIISYDELVKNKGYLKFDSIDFYKLHQNFFNSISIKIATLEGKPLAFQPSSNPTYVSLKFIKKKR